MSNSLLLKSIESGLEDLQAIPLWGTPPPFPWEELAELIAKNFELEDAEASLLKAEYLSHEELTKGFGNHPHIEPFVLSPLPGTCFFLLSQEGKKEIIKLTLYQSHKGKKISDEILEEGFFRSVIVTACGIFNYLCPFGNLLIALEEKTPLPEEGALCLDIALKLGPSKFSVRLAIPKESHAAFRTHFAMEHPPLLSDPSLKNLLLPLHLQIGSTILSSHEWETIGIGDLLLLERCTYDIPHNRGTAQLSLGNTPLFAVRIKEGEVKLLEHAQHLEDTSMTDKHPHEDEFHLEADQDTEETPLWSAPETNEQEERILSSKEIPLSLVVEVGRFTMPLAKLTKLQPGNVLDLGINPQLGVYLTLGGKRVAKGELVKIGEGIGVKILKVGE